MLTAQFPSNIRTFRPVPLPLRGEGLGVGGTRVRDPHRARPLAKGS
jgi:hypothetical protein